MGITVASLHIFAPENPVTLPVAFPGQSRPAADLREAIEKAYKKLGWKAPKRGEGQERQTVLAKSAGGRFLSIHDTACAALDDGTLQELAALTSKSMRTAAIVTTVFDSDTFEFILFHEGKQVDSIVADPDSHTGGLKSVRGHRQAAVWFAAFGGVHFNQIVGRHDVPHANPLALFVAKAKSAATLESPFAEHCLGAWCELAGLPIEATLTRPEDLAQVESVIARLPFAARAAPASGAAASPGRVLKFELRDDTCHHHHFFPAAWPVAPNAEQGFTWPVTCRGGGMASLRLDVHIARTGPFALKKMVIKAFSFYSGQIVSPTELASYEETIPKNIARTAETFSFHAPDFGLRDPTPGSRVQAIILIRPEFDIPGSGEAVITLTLRPDGADEPPMILPKLRIAATPANWEPIVSDPRHQPAVMRMAAEVISGRAARIGQPVQTPAPIPLESLVKNSYWQQVRLILNGPAAHNAIAILPDSGDSVRSSVRDLAERMILKIAEPRGLMATIHTQKHMTPSGSIAKTSQTAPLETLLGGQLWRRLFETARNYQTVRIGIGTADAAAPLAGLTLQTSLRGESGQSEVGTLAASFWAIADEATLSRLSLDSADPFAFFAAWMDDASPLQGWMTKCAWIPEFDSYERYEMTPYEGIWQLRMLRSALTGTCTSPAWLKRHLRFVAPRMWLCRELAAHLDTATLARIANVRETRFALKVELLRQEDLTALEKALEPILPLSESALSSPS